MNITTISKRKSLDYRDFIRDENTMEIPDKIIVEMRMYKYVFPVR